MICWKRNWLVTWRDLVREEDQEWRAGMEVRLVWCRTLADNRWEMEGRVQNLKRVAIDCGSSICFVRRFVMAAKFRAAEVSYEEQKACVPNG